MNTDFTIIDDLGNPHALFVSFVSQPNQITAFSLTLALPRYPAFVTTTYPNTTTRTTSGDPIFVAPNQPVELF